MEKDHDKVFFSTFSIVIGALVVITTICITAARILSPQSATDPDAVSRIDERTRPVGAAITDAAALMKVSTAAAHTPQTADQIVTKVCGACHASGLLNAPKIGDKAAWSARAGAAGGLNGLAASAAKGKNSMPPRGGAADLTDDELKSAIQLMLKQSGV